MLDNFLQILRLQVCTPTYENDFRKAIKALIDSIQEAWGRKDITYYLVSNILLLMLITWIFYYWLTWIFTFSIYSTYMVHILQEMAHWQHGIHKGWRNLIFKQGLHSSGAQEKEVE